MGYLLQSSRVLEQFMERKAYIHLPVGGCPVDLHVVSVYARCNCIEPQVQYGFYCLMNLHDASVRNNDMQHLCHIARKNNAFLAFYTGVRFVVAEVESWQPAGLFGHWISMDPD